MQLSDSLWIQGGVAVEIGTRRLRLFAGGIITTWQWRGDMRIEPVVTDDGSIVLHGSSTMPDWLAVDPLMDGHRPTAIRASHRNDRHDITYSRAGSDIVMTFPKSAWLHRDPRGGYKVRDSHTFTIHLADQHAEHIDRADSLAAIDIAIGMLLAVERHQVVGHQPGGWVYTAEAAAASEVDATTLSWMIDQAIASFPELPSHQATDAASDLAGLAQLSQQLTHQLRGLAWSAVDRYLFAAMLGHRLTTLIRAQADPTDRQQAFAQQLETRLAHMLPPSRLPVALRSQRFVAQTSTSFESLEDLNLWSLYAKRSII